MISKAYCFYCFECLSASFERREPLSLENVVELYDEYTQNSKKRQSSLRLGQLADPVEGTNEHLDGVSTDEEDGDDEVDDDTQEGGTMDERGESKPQLPSISRLQASTPSSSSRSSSTSTPSVLSANSSNSQLPNTTSSSTSTLSSRPSYSSRLSLTSTYPLFVTWNTLSRSGQKSLRGCIGTFDALPLATGLITYALTSAFDDTRFSPIPQSLLPSLQCSLTLLANFEPCADAMDWTLGTHGLRISFTYRGRRHGATYLPHVAIDQGWNMEETIESLMRKAGWDGGSSSNAGVARRILRAGRGGDSDAEGKKPWEEVGDFKVVRYTGLNAFATYKEWIEWNGWAEERKAGRAAR